MTTTPVALLEAQLNVEPGADAQLLAQALAAAEGWIAAHTGQPFPLAHVPATLTQAALMLAAHLYENREASLIGATGQAVPFGVAELLASHREPVCGYVP